MREKIAKIADYSARDAGPDRRPVKDAGHLGNAFGGGGRCLAQDQFESGRRVLYGALLGKRWAGDNPPGKPPENVIFLTYALNEP